MHYIFPIFSSDTTEETILEEEEPTGKIREGRSSFNAPGQGRDTSKFIYKDGGRGRSDFNRIVGNGTSISSYSLLPGSPRFGQSPGEIPYNQTSRPKIGGRNKTRSKSKSNKLRRRPFKPSGILDLWTEDAATISPKVDDDKGDAADSEATTEAPKTAEDHFFSSYGGDIEYFFPLISFGIPFDGEITFLGFHGFKGLFPY
jgi:hypothetical protein